MLRYRCPSLAVGGSVEQNDDHVAVRFAPSALSNGSRLKSA
jgi:hypothetical protein